jgi:hypothetical protein
MAGMQQQERRSVFARNSKSKPNITNATSLPRRTYPQCRALPVSCPNAQSNRTSVCLSVCRAVLPVTLERHGLLCQRFKTLPKKTYSNLDRSSWLAEQGNTVSRNEKNICIASSKTLVGSGVQNLHWKARIKRLKRVREM